MSNVRKTWIGINHLNGRNKKGCKPIVALPNVFNEFFSSVGQTLAASVPPAYHHFSDFLPAVNSSCSFSLSIFPSWEQNTWTAVASKNNKQNVKRAWNLWRTRIATQKSLIVEFRGDAHADFFVQGNEGVVKKRHLLKNVNYKKIKQKQKKTAAATAGCYIAGH